MLERTVDYTKLRHQFGRPIASFQAAQHLIANMHIALAAARLAAQSAVFWIAHGHTGTRETAVRADARGSRGQADHPGRAATPWRDRLRDGDRSALVERTGTAGSTLGGRADVAAAWLEETLADTAARRERR